MGNCWTKFAKWDQRRCPVQKIDSEHVHLVTAMEKWEAKLSEAARDGKIVVANFTASWCRPCVSITPVFCELAEKYPSLVFLTIDVDDLAELSTSLDIKATPTFVFLKDGRQIDRVVGANKADLQIKTAAMDDLVIRPHS